MLCIVKKYLLGQLIHVVNDRMSQADDGLLLSADYLLGIYDKKIIVILIRIFNCSILIFWPVKCLNPVIFDIFVEECPLD